MNLWSEIHRHYAKYYKVNGNPPDLLYLGWSEFQQLNDKFIPGDDLYSYMGMEIVQVARENYIRVGGKDKS